MSDIIIFTISYWWNLFFQKLLSAFYKLTVYIIIVIIMVKVAGFFAVCFLLLEKEKMQIFSNEK